MARQNLIILNGFLLEAPEIHTNEAGENIYATCHVIVTRSTRPVGDGKDHMKCESILVLTQDKDVMNEMDAHADCFKHSQPAWQTFDIVEIKGTLTERQIKKSSQCPECKRRNKRPGSLVFVNPIYVRRIDHMKSREECMTYLNANKEVSNQALVVGDLCRDPSQVTMSSGITFTQYQIAINRKFHIREDAPHKTTDFPWVKSYGENGARDLQRLHIGSSVLIDGFLQARTVQRHAVCGQALDEKGRPQFDSAGNAIMQKDLYGDPVGCGTKYDWADQTTELVPYASEYLMDFYSEEEAEAVAKKKAEDVARQQAENAAALRRSLFGEA